MAKREYTVWMTHHMKSVVIVYAEDEEEAMEKARAESFDDKTWEESDTDYDRISEGPEIPDDDERLL